MDLKKEAYVLSDDRKIRKKVMADFVSMLNSSGGMILLGVDDDGELKGLENENIEYDKYKNRILQILDTNIEPQIFGVEIKKITKGPKEFIAILIPEGTDKPYCIKLQGEHSMEFMVRQDGSNKHMRLDQVKKLILSGSLIDSNVVDWESWVKLQLQKIIDNNWRLSLKGVKSLNIFLTPVKSKPTDSIFTTEEMHKVNNKKPLIFQPPASNNLEITSSDEGVFIVGRQNGVLGAGNPCYSFINLTNNGAIHIYDSIYVQYVEANRQIEQSFDKYCFKFIESSLEILKANNFLNYEYDLRIIFIGGKGYKIKPAIDLPGLFSGLSLATGIPDDLYEFKCRLKVGSDYKSQMKPLLDKIWQVSGFEKCSRYNERGEFIGGTHED